MRREKNYKWLYEREKAIIKSLRKETEYLREALELTRNAHHKAVLAWIHAEDQWRYVNAPPQPGVIE